MTNDEREDALRAFAESVGWIYHPPRMVKLGDVSLPNPGRIEVDPDGESWFLPDPSASMSEHFRFIGVVLDKLEGVTPLIAQEFDAPRNWHVGWWGRHGMTVGRATDPSWAVLLAAVALKERAK